ncbi:MAG: P-II family nitrogen regulator [Wenzhouxiangella sp.]
MNRKLLVVTVEAAETDQVIAAAREAGASGATLIHQARGEGRRELGQLMALSLDASRDIVLIIVTERQLPAVIDAIAKVASLDDTPGTGVLFQLDIEDAVGLDKPAMDAGYSA